MKYKNYLVKQHDMADCAAACLSMVCMYYKKEITITKLRDAYCKYPCKFVRIFA